MTGLNQKSLTRKTSRAKMSSMRHKRAALYNCTAFVDIIISFFIHIFFNSSPVARDCVFVFYFFTSLARSIFSIYATLPVRVGDRAPTRRRRGKGHDTTKSIFDPLKDYADKIRVKYTCTLTSARARKHTRLTRKNAMR